MRRVLTALGVVAVSSVMITAPAVAATAPAPVTASSTVRHVRVDGYSLAVNCTGFGSQTVVLLSGFGDPLSIWSGIQHALSPDTRVCSYDRPGEGASSKPHGTQTLASEASLLHDLLARLDIHRNLILVGHSLGGDIAAWYAQHYRWQIAGVVLLDATPVNFLQYVTQVIPPSATGLAAALRQEAVTTIDGDNPERFRIAGGNWAHPGSLHHIPLAIAEHGKDIFAATGSYDAPLQSAWARGQLGWAPMSWRSEVVIATRSGHYIYVDQPQLALDLIRAVIGESMT